MTMSKKTPAPEPKKKRKRASAAGRRRRLYYLNVPERNARLDNIRDFFRKAVSDGILDKVMSSFVEIYLDIYSKGKTRPTVQAGIMNILTTLTIRISELRKEGRNIPAVDEVIEEAFRDLAKLNNGGGGHELKGSAGTVRTKTDIGREGGKEVNKETKPGDKAGKQ